MGIGRGLRGIVAVAAALLLLSAPAAAQLSLEIPPTLNEQTRTVPIKGTITSVIVRTELGDIYVAPGSASSVRINETWNYARPTVTQSLKDGVLRVTASCPADMTSFNKCSTDLALAVPKDVTVDAHSNFGHITTKYLNGNERLVSNFGTIKAAGVSAWSITTLTDYGEVRLDLVSAPKGVTAESDFGDVSIKVPSGIYDVTASTDFGDVSITGITRDDDATRHITAHSSYGDVAIARR